MRFKKSGKVFSVAEKCKVIKLVEEGKRLGLQPFWTGEPDPKQVDPNKVMSIRSYRGAFKSSEIDLVKCLDKLMNEVDFLESPELIESYQVIETAQDDKVISNPSKTGLGQLERFSAHTNFGIH